MEQQRDAQRWQGGVAEAQRRKRSRLPPGKKTAMVCKARQLKESGCTFEQIAARLEHVVSATTLWRWCRERD
jgi:hypothetical protein